jgi:hypothetical protein
MIQFNCDKDRTWRVFLANSLPSLDDWKFEWDKRNDYLLPMTRGDRTLGDIGITPENNQLLFFIN